MIKLVYAYASTGVAFLVLDGLWLSIMAPLVYKPLLGPMMQEPFNLPPAALFYLIYIAGVVFFAVQPAFTSGHWSTAMVNGAALGFVAYATYDLTNHATLKNWPGMLTVVDMAWGTIATSLAATLGFLIARLLTSVLPS